MGLLDCVASPEEKDYFDESERPFPRPRQLSKSDHDISRRRGRPLFSSQSNLKNVRDIDFWRTRVLRFIFFQEGREDIRVLKVPFKQLGYQCVTDFIAEIPADLFNEFLPHTPPDDGIVKDDKVFWVHDGIAEPGTFKWQGVLDNVPIVGLQLDRKKAVPFGIHDGKGLFYCKPGHRALVPDHEITPYKKFLRSFLGLPPRQDSLLGIRDSVRYSAKAIAAKNSKPGDRVFLPKEQKWATVQWIGKIEGDTVVDLVYEPPKSEAGKIVSPDDPCISRSMSLADFIGELESVPNTPLGPPSQPEQLQTMSKTIEPQTPTQTLTVATPISKQPLPPSSPLPDSSDETGSSEEADSYDEESGDSESEENTGSESESDSEPSVRNATDGESDLEEDTTEPPQLRKNSQYTNEIKTVVNEDNLSPTIPSPKRKGFFGFAKNKKEKRFKASNLKTEKKSEFASLPEIKAASPPPRTRNTNLFSSWRFKKGSKPHLESPQREVHPEIEAKTPEVKTKSRLSSSWGALFKSKSKSQLQKFDFDDATMYEECSTPIDEMRPPDNIPTPPPTANKVDVFQERRIERQESTLGNTLKSCDEPLTNVAEGPYQQKQEGSLHPNGESSSEYETSETESEEGEPTGAANVAVEVHESPKSPIQAPVLPTNTFGTTGSNSATLEKEAVKEGTIPMEQSIEHVATPAAHNAEMETYSVDDKRTSIDRFKESKIRNRPTSFGSFLARIKNLTPDSEIGTSNKDDESKEITDAPVTLESERKESLHSITSHSTDASDGHSSGQVMTNTSGNIEMPQPVAQSVKDNDGNQDDIRLDSLEVEDSSPPINSPPPIPASDPPKRRPSRNRSFTFSFSTGRRKSQPSTPTGVSSPLMAVHMPEDSSTKGMEYEPEDETLEKPMQKTSSFRNSFKRTFSFSRNKKRPSIDDGPSSPTGPTTPSSSVGKPRPLTMYNDEPEEIERKGSFKKKRPTSLVVDIKPWNSRHTKSRTDPYSSPSSDESPVTPMVKSPNAALLPKQNPYNIPKHRIFTTPSIFTRKSPKPEDVPVAKKDYKRWSTHELDSNEENIAPTVKSPTVSVRGPEEQVVPDKATQPEVDAEHGIIGGKLKSALKQRKEIECIPNGLKVNDRVLWYSTEKGPVAGTVQRLFKDGTDKYTAMVKFDREVQEEPLRLVREGDAYIITVEELITTNMFEPMYVNQSEIVTPKISTQPATPTSPSVRFDGVAAEEPVPTVVVTSDSTNETVDHDLPPPFQEEEVTMACGFRRGVQSRDKSCCLETILFSLFYTTNAFDITMLYANSHAEDSLTRSVRQILRKEIVDPLRREGFSPWYAVKKLRDAVKPLSDEWQTMSTDAEVMMFILFDRALKLQKFISYSNNMSDFLHQLVVDPKDLAKSTTVQHLFETSLQMMEKIKLKTVPTPALILEMPRSNDKLMQYQAVVPNLTLTVSHILEGGPRLCICGAVAQFECSTCTSKVGTSSIVYCENCKSTADVIHFQLPHDTSLIPLAQSLIVLDLSAIICVKRGHYFSFVKCGQSHLSPWVFFDGAELDNPKVCIEQNLSMWLDRLEKYPGRYQDALQYPLLTHILQDSHICIYKPREKSSSV